VTLQVSPPPLHPGHIHLDDTLQVVPYRITAHNFTTAIGKYKPQDATTNPSLILAASKKAEYAKLMDVAIEYGKKHGGSVDDQVDAALDRLLVEFGKEILKIIPGKVSTEVDARFSFDTKASIDKALHIIEVFMQKKGPESKSPRKQELTLFRPSLNSSTSRSASPRTASSSRSPPHGRASRPPRSSSATTASTAT